MDSCDTFFPNFVLFPACKVCGFKCNTACIKSEVKQREQQYPHYASCGITSYTWTCTITGGSMTLFWLLISAWIDWFSGEQLSSMNKMSTALMAFFLCSPLLPLSVYLSFHCPLKLRMCSPTIFWYVKWVCAMTSGDSTNWQLWSSVKYLKWSSRHHLCILQSALWETSGIQLDSAREHSIRCECVQCVNVCLRAWERAGESTSLSASFLHAAWPN